MVKHTFEILPTILGQGFFPNFASNIKRFNLINFLFFLKWSENLWFLMILGEIDVD